MVSSRSTDQRRAVARQVFGPEWRGRIDIERLNIQCSYDYVLGQLHGTYGASRCSRWTARWSRFAVYEPRFRS
jgi:hypothetical protein